MPAPNSTLTFGNRDHLINPKFYKEYLEKRKEARDYNPEEPVIDYQTFTEVIKASNELIAKTVTEDPEGFKLPDSLGYIIVTRYQTKNRPTNYKKTKEFDTKVIHNNLHSGGDMFALRWFNKYVTKNLFSKIYKFKGCREFTRAVSASIRKETPFLSWSNRDFFNYNKVDKLYNKIKKHGSN